MTNPRIEDQLREVNLRLMRETTALMFVPETNVIPGSLTSRISFVPHIVRMRRTRELVNET